MSSLKKSASSASDKSLSLEQQQEKINEVRQLLGPLSTAMPNFVTDPMISRFLRLRNWNAKKASKTLKEAVKWRLDYKPEAIRWEDIAHEAETGKIYRTDYFDKQGRIVLVVRPGFQNTTSAKGQIKCFTYHLENAIMNMPEGQEQIVWLTDFQGWTLASTQLKVSRASLYILQYYYPEMVGLAIVYNPPKIFESFWKLLKPFVEDKLYESVKFVYSNNLGSQKVIADYFDMDKIEAAYGGKNQVGFDINTYAKRMREDDKKMEAFWKANDGLVSDHQLLESILQEAQPCSLLTEAEQDDSTEPLELDDLKLSPPKN